MRMTGEQVGVILGALATVYPLDVKPATLMVWGEVLADIPFEVAHEASILVMRDSAVQFVKPSHIIDKARTIEGDIARVRAAALARGLAARDGYLSPDARAHLRRLIETADTNRRSLEGRADA